VVSAGLLIPLGVFGGTGLAQSSSPAQVQYKITICHHTHSKKHPTVTISVSAKAWKAHARHGDTIGTCAQAKKAKTHGKANAKGHTNGHSQKPATAPAKPDTKGQAPKPDKSQDANHANTNGLTHGGHGK
jgi:hypothetical protein